MIQIQLFVLSIPLSLGVGFRLKTQWLDFLVKGSKSFFRYLNTEQENFYFIILATMKPC